MKLQGIALAYNLAMYRNRFALALLVSAAARATVPTIDESLSMKSVAGAQISPDGRYVAYSVTQTNWDENDFISQIWIAVTATGERYQLTSGKKSSTGPQWSPDSRRLAFTSDRDGKRQIYRHLAQRRRSHAAYIRGQRRRRHRLVARRRVDRVHLQRARIEGQEGSQGEVRRFRNHRRRLCP